MKSSLYLIPLFAVGLSGPAAAADYLNQDEAQKAYMSPEIDVAVEAAKRTSGQADYVGYEWYNRTTSKSFPLPKMLNTEMNSLVIEGAMGPTAAGEAASEEASKPVRDVALGKKTEDDDVVEADDNLKPDAPEKLVRRRVITIDEVQSESKSGLQVVRNARAAVDVSVSSR